MTTKISKKAAEGGLIGTVSEMSGVDLSACYQCRKCSSGCPVGDIVDSPPSEIMRRLHLGAGDELLESELIWVCASCETCSARCPMGIEVARRAGIPSLLVENFTWDWIYEGYVKHDQRIGRHILYLKELFEAADFHIQTEPVSYRRNANLTTYPVSRKTRNTGYDIRKRLRIPEGCKAVLITMGGIREDYGFLEQLAQRPDIHFLIPGAGDRQNTRDNLVLLSHHSEFFHPDLVNACDGVIGKVGYSTLSEVYYAGVPFGYIARRDFRESRFLVSYIKDHIKGIPIDEDSFYSGNWLSCLSDLLDLPRVKREVPDGAAQTAAFIYTLLKQEP